MADAKEIRTWAFGEHRPDPRKGDPNAGRLLFAAPHLDPAPGVSYLRCAGEQRVVVETEIAAQLAELNETMRAILEELMGK